MKTADPSRRQSTLRSYPGPWKGQLLLACGKCQRKLKKSQADDFISLKKLLTRERKKHSDGLRLRVLNVPCLKMCPRDAVTVCTPAQVACRECCIVRIPEDIATLYQQCGLEGSSS
jgi:hypothetical protein